MRKIKYQTRWQRFVNQCLKNAPKISVTPLYGASKEDQEKAELMQKLVNYMFENNTNGFQDKYFACIKREMNRFAREEVKAIWESKEALERATKINLNEVLNKNETK